MLDFLLLGGIVLCLLSVLVAIAQLLQTRPPRAAAILLILGIAMIFAAAYLAPKPFGLDQIPEAFDRVTGRTATSG